MSGETILVALQPKSWHASRRRDPWLSSNLHGQVPTSHVPSRKRVVPQIPIRVSMSPHPSSMGYLDFGGGYHQTPGTHDSHMSILDMSSPLLATLFYCHYFTGNLPFFLVGDSWWMVVFPLLLLDPALLFFSPLSPLLSLISDLQTPPSLSFFRSRRYVAASNYS